jgi:hypothetical protein
VAAWKHDNTTGWKDGTYYEKYRMLVASKAPGFRKRDEDCADLSMLLLVQFAAQNGLALTFEDNAERRYISKAPGTILTIKLGEGSLMFTDPSWSTPDEYYAALRQRIGAESLWKHNTVKNPHGPQPGDLLLSDEHAALVYFTYPPGLRHPKQDDMSVPNFPGPDEAKKQVNVTEYFKGTVLPGYGLTVSRLPDQDAHFDYLNSRADAKRNAELIYFANARQAHDDGFEFRAYSLSVLNNWTGWDGNDLNKYIPPW